MSRMYSMVLFFVQSQFQAIRCCFTDCFFVSVIVIGYIHWSSSACRLSEFLADCAERICLLRIIHRRLINRFQRFLLWLGYPRGIIQETKITIFCKILSEFALEYRTTRERIMTQKLKKQNRNERKKTRGLLITQVHERFEDLHRHEFFLGSSRERRESNQCTSNR